MDSDLKSFNITANELEILIELEHHKHGKTYEKLARELHVTKDKVEELVKNLVAKDLVADDNGTVISTESGKELCKKVEKHRVETPIKLQMLSNDETMGLVNVLKKMLEKEEN
ncbi:MarR family transcriptional regulator [Lactobacillus helveticus]|uniref:MarR family transcriptional regulator n=1 Tax=Lactobacillus helveticus TaxID=1587 RepID=UPI00081A446D|nr:MarR family transcriptional regulator [Lactobacillus helveticus]ANZ55596.1 transcriptional regulator [Lactobacillus helveticus]AQY53703.1 MarR family transcriptional regulator [Lactobacillus helveticus]MBU6033704.1 MarR family transcriptional regulator [Lactobacillus helveticus]MBW1219284.1 MarR family transcriptional regulator [Lactobacillus helveticus]MDY0874683.1 MarR family transcriptional regulator [Lactobacillus helveticus]